MSSSLFSELEARRHDDRCVERFVRTGRSGGLELILDESPTGSATAMSSFPCGFPPVSSTERVQTFLLQPGNTSLGNPSRAQKFWPREKNVSSILNYDVSSCTVESTVDRANNSLHLLETGNRKDPEISSSETSSLLVVDPSIIIAKERGHISDLLSCPPGFSEGMTFKTSLRNTGGADLTSVLTEDIDIENLMADRPESPTTEKDDDEEEEDTDDDLALPKVTLTKESTATISSWATVVDSADPVVDFHRQLPNMAMTWPFELDPFQKQAILHLERGDNVFVAAHTSAGKTVIAEYAIALARQHMTRIIYTSPIKALSNQKFRDFKTTFEDVGLLTGDVRIKAESSCLIMTTEILRSMLYNGSEVVRDVEWVVFDECHYVNDAERGVVWEETLIMLPPHVHIILLSATVPNTVEFAEWIGQTKKRKIYVIGTMKRPVPLEHYLYTGNSHATSKEMFLLVNSSGKFLTKGYQDAVNAPKLRSGGSKSGASGKDFKGRNVKQDFNIWQSIITRLHKDNALPAVAFTFSRKRCDEYASGLRSIDLTTNDEKSEIHVFFRKSVSLLKGPDQKLPQIKILQGELKRGIGVHHSGILPIMKEVIELLFQRGLVKLLFATETFAMGVNMPARTVVFDALQKHDGASTRYLLPSEYIQMAGRAGRRGLDATGTVVTLCKDKVPEASDLHSVMLGLPTRLISKFRLTYNMILNLLRFDELRVEDMMKRSFAERELQREVQRVALEHDELKEKLANFDDGNFSKCDDIHAYYETYKEIEKLEQKVQSCVLRSSQGAKVLTPGRVVLVSSAEYCRSLGVIMKATGGSGSRFSTSQPSLTVLLLPGEAQDSTLRTPMSGGVLMTMCQPSSPVKHCIVTVAHSAVIAITRATLKADWDSLAFQHSRHGDANDKRLLGVVQELLRVAENYSTGVETVHPIQDLNIKDLEFVDAVRDLERKRERLLTGFQCVDSPHFGEAFRKAEEKYALSERLSHVEYVLSDDSLQLLPEYGQRVQVLKSLRYLDDQSRVQLKGRVACEISTHELMITEMVFRNVVSDLEPAEIVALLSCFVFQQKRCLEPNLTETLQSGKDVILQLAFSLTELQSEAGVTSEADDYVENLHFGLVEVVFEWARGKPFCDIIGLTDVQEGVIVRCIQRLSETCHDVRSAARLIGDPHLYDKMDEAAQLIKRDIVFAASLYTR